jgi:hypothetical protein
VNPKTIPGLMLAMAAMSNMTDIDRAIAVSFNHAPGTLPPLEQQPINPFAFERKMSRRKRKKLRLKGSR